MVQVKTGPSTAVPGAPRSHSDRCPTAIQLHRAADGLLARVRLPGGRITPAAARGLAALAGPGDQLELTGRANLQLRALTPQAAAGLPSALHALGLHPSAEHERARTILACPRLGRSGPSTTPAEAIEHRARLDALVTEVEDAILAVPQTASLSGRAMTVICDAAGHPLAAEADLLIEVDFARPVEQVARLWIGDHLAGSVPLDGAATRAGALLGAIAEACTASGVWRVRELTDGGRRITTAAASPTAGPAAPFAAPHSALQSTATAEPLGATAQAGGYFAVRGLAPLGRLEATQLVAVAALAEQHGTDLRLDVDRSVSLVDLGSAAAAQRAAGVLSELGFATDPRSPWAGLSACAGLGCSKSLTDVRGAARLVARGRRPGDAPQHLVGCERRCGAPPVGQTILAVAGDTPASLAARAASHQKDRPA